MKVGKDLLDVSILKNYLSDDVLDINDENAIYHLDDFDLSCNVVISTLIFSRDIYKIELGLNLLKNNENNL